jgi:hypothetical protein
MTSATGAGRLDPCESMSDSSAVTGPTERSPSPASTILRIAVGVDGGSGGNDAVMLATEIAGTLHAELMLVAVAPEPLIVLPEARR